MNYTFWNLIIGRKKWCTILLCMLSLGLFSNITIAAEIFVTSTGSVGHMDQDPNGNCSFPEAIEAANTNLAVDACAAGTFVADGSDEIILPSGATFPANVAIAGNALPEITQNVIITGNGSTIERDATAKFRLMTITNSWVTLDKMTFKLGDADTGNGGAILIKGNDIPTFSSIIIQDCVFTDNTATNGGAIAVDERGFVRISASEFRDNQASNHGGAIYLVGISPNVIEDSRIENNLAGQYGGGIYVGDSTQIRRSVLNLNEASFGGAIYFGNNTMYLEETSLSNNTAIAAGGGIYAGDNAGRASIYRSVIHNNHSYNAGGIYAQFHSSSFLIAQSTISGNDNEQIYADSYIFLSSSTVIGKDNSLVIEQFQYVYPNIGPNPGNRLTELHVQNSVVASENVSNPTLCDFVYSNPQNETAHNWFQDASCTNTGPANGDPMLGPLEDNGGRTLSHKPLKDSPLIDNGQSTRLRLFITSSLNILDEGSIDQRGQSREPFAPDIGAIEIQNGSPFVIPIGNDKSILIFL